MHLKVRVHQEEGSYWAEVPQLPGCFASGHTFDELLEALQEAIGLCLDDADRGSGPLELEVAEMTVAAGPAEPQAA